MTVLTRQAILKLMNASEEKDISKRLIITPLLNPEEDIGASSVDLRLGHQFILFQRYSFPVLDIGKYDPGSEEAEKYQKRIVKRHGEGVTIHPGQYVIGSTLEYIKLPPRVMGYVIGKSTWGRMGLIIATATKVDPGFCGVITLEIVNDGEVPIILYPGIPIAQFVLHSTEGNEVAKSRYEFAVGPQFPKFNTNRDWQYWTKQRLEDNS